MNDPRRLAAVIREMHGCQATHQCSERVTETFRGETVWDGVVEVFSITGRDDTDTAYAWTYEDDGKLHHLAVLGVPPINSAQDAVRAAVVAEARKFERGSAWPGAIVLMLLLLLLFYFFPAGSVR